MKRLRKIRYQVEDTWDTEQPDVIFEPAGSNIEEGKNFVINPFALIGYFDGHADLPYELVVRKPKGFYGATALIPEQMSATVDRFRTRTYHELADSPLMYCAPDTAILKMGETEVLVSVYSPNQVLDAQTVSAEIRDVLMAQRQYLGGNLPVRKYAFIIYLSDQMNLSGMMGALEHSLSSFYFLPELSPDYLSQTIRDIAAHEFFHILTPLNIHSEQIHNFDYFQPEMSKHLWLYEGVTEYAAGHMQVKYGLMDLPTYLDVLRGKMANASVYQDSLPFTQMSQHVLEKYQDQYSNVYEKGALIGLCLDIALLKHSGGKYNLQQLMRDLAKKYGKDRPFQDDALFEEIAQTSQLPQIRTFFRRYIEGPEPLPIAESLDWIGIHYQEVDTIREIGLGSLLNALEIGEGNNVLIVSDTIYLDEDVRGMGYLPGDEIDAINGKKVTLESILSILEEINQTANEGDPLEVTVVRAQAGKEEKESVTLKGKMITTETIDYFSMKPLDNPSAEQLSLFQAWLSVQK